MSVPYHTVPYQVKYSTESSEAYRNLPENADNLRTLRVLAIVDKIQSTCIKKKRCREK